MTGTEVSKAASSIVRSDDNGATARGEEGRQAWENFEKTILSTLPTDGGQVVLIGGGILAAPCDCLELVDTDIRVKREWMGRFRGQE